MEPESKGLNQQVSQVGDQVSNPEWQYSVSETFRQPTNVLLILPDVHQPAEEILKQFDKPELLTIISIGFIQCIALKKGAIICEKMISVVNILMVNRLQDIQNMSFWEIIEIKKEVIFLLSCLYPN